MKWLPGLLLLAVLASLTVALSEKVAAQNSINGLVFDESRKAVANIDVELLDDFERLTRRTKTNGAGLFMFNNIPAGIYYVRIRVSGTPFVAAKERVEIGVTNRVRNGRLTGAESRQVNFYLRAKEKHSKRAVTGVVFAQSVPSDAKAAYVRGMSHFKGGRRNEALVELESAVRLFSDYFDARLALGQIHFEAGQYENAARHFARARSINQKSFEASFGAGLSYSKLNQNGSAIEFLDFALGIEPRSARTHLEKGIVLRNQRKTAAALQSLLTAKQFSRTEYPDVHWNLALLYWNDLKDPGKAADELELFLKAIPAEEKEQYRGRIEEVKQLIKSLRAKVK